MKIDQYIKILEEELVVALGCTEPVALAYASNLCYSLLNKIPDKIEVFCSGNIIKNVKSVIIPNTNKKGIDVAVLFGMLIESFNDPMDIFSGYKYEDLLMLEELLNKKICIIKRLETEDNLHIIIKMFYKNEYSLVEIKSSHTNVVRKEKNGVIIEKKCSNDLYLGSMTSRDCLNINDIYSFAQNVELGKVNYLLDPILELNKNIALEGMDHDYGLNIGKVLLQTSNNLWHKCISYTAAASEARMCGCALGVVTNSGSGNQGLASTVPIIFYGLEKGYDLEKIKRALLFSSLLTIFQKVKIGRLSAFCGVVSATCSAGAGIAFLDDFSLEQINKTISNTLANSSGIICDGAKASCAAKIYSGLNAAFLAYLLAKDQKSYQDGEGIVKCDVEKTIDVVGKIAKDGMKQTDLEIIKLMINE